MDRYLDFDLRIEKSGEGYRAQVVDSPAGQATVDFRLPFSAMEIENLLYKVGRPRRGTRRIGSPEMAAVKAFGQRLFEAAFAGEVNALLRSSLVAAEGQGAGLRIRLVLSRAPELNDLPWEYLYNAPLNRFFSLSAETPLVRYIDLPEPVRPLRIESPLRVLVMVASPSDYPPLDVKAEWQTLKKALRQLEAGGKVVLHRLPQASLAALQRQLRKDTCHVFHFIGHGGFDTHADDGVLVMEDENGRGHPVSGSYLGTLLHDHRPLRLAVLNACEGARTGSTDPFAGTAQSLLQQGIPAVIGMQFEITDEAAITFAREFYMAVAEGLAIDTALAEARKAIFAQGNDVEWGTPVLYLRSADGHVFDVHASPAPPAPPPPTVAAAAPVAPAPAAHDAEVADLPAATAAATATVATTVVPDAVVAPAAAAGTATPVDSPPPLPQRLVAATIEPPTAPTAPAAPGRRPWRLGLAAVAATVVGMALMPALCTNDDPTPITRSSEPALTTPPAASEASAAVEPAARPVVPQVESPVDGRADRPGAGATDKVTAAPSLPAPTIRPAAPPSGSTIVPATAPTTTPAPRPATAPAVTDGGDATVDRLWRAAIDGQPEARSRLIELARRDNASAQFRYGQLLHEPAPTSGIERDVSQAVNWWLRASALGHGRASMAAANLFDHGENGVRADHARALKLYELALVQGWVNPTSQTRLARALLRTGDAQQCSRILSLLREAQAGGFAEATAVLESDRQLRTLCRP